MRFGQAVFKFGASSLAESPKGRARSDANYCHELLKRRVLIGMDRRFEPRRFAPCLEIFRKKYRASGLFRRPQNQSIPEGEPMKAVQVDGGQYVRQIGTDHVEPS